MAASQHKRSRAEAPPLANAEDFGRFFDQNHLDVFRFVYALHGGPQEEVEDLAAETFLRAWRARRRFAGDGKDALRWVLRIARNLVYDAHRRRARRQPPVNLEEQKLKAPTAGPEEQLVLQESERSLLAALGNLPEARREMVILRYLLGWRVNDVAAHLDMAENTVSVSLRRALAKMREAWPEEEIA
jgi:RNA polymerase sigma-70 factor (ECF subfamily)